MVASGLQESGWEVSQLGLFGDPAKAEVWDLEGGGRVSLRRGWLASRQGATLDGVLWRMTEEIAWTQREFEFGGSRIPMPRLEAFYGDPGLTYSYSGETYAAIPWTARLAALRDRVNECTGYVFNGVFCNLYRDGSDSVGWHADDEHMLGPAWPDDIAIASVSVGASRDFAIKRKSDMADKMRWTLNHGDLLVMSGAMQRDWVHCVPKTKKPVGSRVNLTFRILLPT